MPFVVNVARGCRCAPTTRSLTQLCPTASRRNQPAFRSSSSPFPPPAHRRHAVATASMSRAGQINQICVVGGGNGAHLLSALLAHAHAQDAFRARVTLLAPFRDEGELLRRNATSNGGITVENHDGSTFTGMPHLITADPKSALQNTQIVLLPLPTYAIPPILQLIAPYLENGCWVGALPAQGGFQWIAANYLDTREQGKSIKLFGLDKLPFSCRILEYGKRVKAFGYKQNLALACVPNKPDIANIMAATLSDFIPRSKLYTVPNFLVLTLATSNQCLNPPRMYGLFSERTVIDHNPLFYEEMDDLSADVMERLSDEMLTIARAIQKKSEDMGQTMDLSCVLSIAESTTRANQVADSSSLKRIFQTCAGFAGIKTPLKKAGIKDGVQMYEVDWECRYFTEDIPALCVVRGLGQLLAVDTPTIDMLIRWAQKGMDGGYEFLTKDNKLNTDRRKMMYNPQYWGILNAEALVRFHS
ncbi:6-phosphogluconate dehydrogenase [Gracilaria domingensis]|nr:6-phosphogluconate dehydrogenase [Gracilaria domingensis]